MMSPNYSPFSKALLYGPSVKLDLEIADVRVRRGYGLTRSYPTKSREKKKRHGSGEGLFVLTPQVVDYLRLHWTGLDLDCACCCSRREGREGEGGFVDVKGKV